MQIKGLFRYAETSLSEDVPIIHFSTRSQEPRTGKARDQWAMGDVHSDGRAAGLSSKEARGSEADSCREKGRLWGLLRSRSKA